MRGAPLKLACLLLLLLASPALAALHFPALSGRVVDAANILSPQVSQALDKQLAEYENGTSNQVVVVTLPSLEGYPIEQYGYQLGRYWKVGQKDKNNGLLLIVAPNERKVRIEVGYGLEPVMTDAAASQIVNMIILPRFRSGDMQRGITEGTDAILSVLGGHGVPLPQGGGMESWEAWLILMLFLWFFLFAAFHPGTGYFIPLGVPSRFGSSRSSGWGGGGFRGGGGSFGGGGASGGW